MKGKGKTGAGARRGTRAGRQGRWERQRLRQEQSRNSVEHKRVCVSSISQEEKEKGRTAAQMAEAEDAGHRSSLSLCSSQPVISVVIPAASHPRIVEADVMTKVVLTDLIARRRVEVDY
jgi:hypothetical protein